MLTGFLRNVVPTGASRPWAFAERIFTCPPGEVTEQNIGTIGSAGGAVYAHLEPTGARWPDDSYRFLRVSVLAQNLGGSEARAVNLEPLSAVPAFQFALSDWARGIGFTAQADGFGLAGSGTWRNVSVNPCRIITQHQFRFGPGGAWWAEIEYDAIHQSDSVPFRVRLGFSDPRIPDMQARLAQGIQLDIDAPVIVGVRAAAAKGISVAPHVGGHGYTIRVLGPGTVVDGQSIAFRGTVLLMPQALVDQVPAGTGITPETASIALGRLMQAGPIPTDWVERLTALYVCELQTPVRCVQGMIGDGWAPSPLPHLPFVPSWVAQDATVRWANANSAPVLGGQPFQPPVLGHIATPEGTGSQKDLGLERWDAMLMRPDPAADETIARACEFEAGRPSHFREADGSEMDGVGHPQLRIWYGRPHFSPSESPDRLGKGTAALPTAAGGLEQRGWEHFTINYAFAAWLTGDRLAQDELRSLDTLWRFSSKGLTQQSFLNSPGAARHTARFIWSGMQLYMAGSAGALDLCMFRADAARPSTGPVGTVLSVRGPAANFLPTMDSWIAYEESDAAVSLFALASMVERINPTKAARYRDLSWEILKMVVRYGYEWQNGVPVPATAVAWNGGVELTVTQLVDRTYRTLFPGSDYQWWILPGVLLARSLSKVGGPREDAAIWAEADRIVKAVVAQRRATSDGRWDDKGGWLVSVPQGEQS